MRRELPGVLSQGGGLFPPVGTALNDCTWEQIRAISDAGLAADYFSVGDRKGVTLNGTVGSLTFSNETYYVYIIGIDHNSRKEGTNRIHFQFGFSALSGGVHIAFVDSGYGSAKTSGSWFNIRNDTNTTDGWTVATMRTEIFPAFKNSMPSDLQAVLKVTSKASTSYSSGVSTFSEDIFLLSEYEVFGETTFSNSIESEYQEQYEWYTNSNNPKARFRHSNTDSTATWYLRSKAMDYTGAFCAIRGAGRSGTSTANASQGFSPAFCV